MLASSGEQEDADSLEIGDVKMASDENTPARNIIGKPDLDDVSLLYAHVMEGSLPD